MSLYVSVSNERNRVAEPGISWAVRLAFTSKDHGRDGVTRGASGDP